MALLQPQLVQMGNVTSAFLLLLGLPHDRLPVPQVRLKYPLSRLCLAGSFWWDASARLFEGFPQFTTLTRRLFVANP
jgi:hypothetical protein